MLYGMEYILNENALAIQFKNNTEVLPNKNS